jgi:aspartate aminotransferase
MTRPRPQTTTVIHSDLERLLEPLERFEGLRRRVVRKGDRLCDLSYANPYRGVHETAKAAIREAIENERLLGLQYTPFGGQTLARRFVADALRASHGLDFTFQDVVLTPGAMGAVQLALRTAGRPGDHVVIPIPCWLDYPLYARFTDLVSILVPLGANSFDLDVAAVAGAVTSRTCAVLLCHPANPTGRSYGLGALSALAEALRDAEDRTGARITLIADETHRDFLEPGEYHSATAVFDRSLIVYSFGKYHFMQGQRLGYVATSPRHPGREAAAAELVRWARITGLATPTAVMQRAIPKLLALEHDRGWLIRWRKRFVEELETSGYSVVRPDGTLFVYVRTPAEYDDFEFAEVLALADVLVLPAPVFHHESYFRVSLTGGEHILERALPILDRFVKK